jgi:hypothetical protein
MSIKNLLERLASVQVIQLTNLFMTNFSTKPEDKEDEGPLNWLMSLYVFPHKVVKGHLNASFQSNELNFINPRLSIHFSMAPRPTKLQS